MFKKKLESDMINMESFADFEAKSAKYNINYCKNYFETMKSELLKQKNIFNNTCLFIIRTSYECKATDLYINNKIKLLKKFGIKVCIIYLKDIRTDIDYEIEKLINTMKYYIRRKKNHNFYYLLQKDSHIDNESFSYIYKNINNMIKINNLNLSDVEIINPSYLDNDSYSIQLHQFILSMKNNESFDFSKLLIGPCTPIGAINMLKFYNKIKIGDNCIVYGKSEILGRPLYDTLSQIGCTVLTFNSNSNQTIYDSILKDVNNVFLCMSSSDFFNDELYNKIDKNKCNIIDFGINYDKGYLTGNISDSVLKDHSEKSRNSIITATPSGTALSTLIQIPINIFYNELIRR